jgi:hypothetical protein
MMNRYFLTIILVMIQISCSQSFDRTSDSRKLSSEANEISTPSDIPATIKSKKPINKTFKDVIYATLLEKICWDRVDKEYTFDAGNWLVYRNDTIAPVGVEQLETEIPFDLLKNFNIANEKPERLKNKYDVMVAVDPNSGNQDMSQFYVASKRKFPTTNAVVAFSNIGISDDHEQALIYVEYFSPKQKLLKVYFRFWLEMYSINYDFDQIAGFPDSKLYFVKRMVCNSVGFRAQSTSSMIF